MARAHEATGTLYICSVVQAHDYFAEFCPRDWRRVLHFLPRDIYLHFLPRDKYIKINS
jgi:hypothetical protein